MDPWLQALRLHRQKKKGYYEGSSELEWGKVEEKYYEDSKTHSYRERNASRDGTVMKRPPLGGDREEFIGASSRETWRKRRKNLVEPAANDTKLSSSGGTTMRNIKEQDPGLTGEHILLEDEEGGDSMTRRKNDKDFHKNSSNRQNGNTDVTIGKSTVKNLVSGKPTAPQADENTTSLRSTETETETLDKEDPQKLLEELRRIEEELAKARQEQENVS